MSGVWYLTDVSKVAVGREVNQSFVERQSITPMSAVSRFYGGGSARPKLRARAHDLDGERQQSERKATALEQAQDPSLFAASCDGVRLEPLII